MRVDARPVYSEAPAREGLEARRIRRGEDWDGAVVLLREQVETVGGSVIPAGLEARAVGWRRGRGVRLRTDCCPTCGVRVGVVLPPRDVVYLGHRAAGSGQHVNGPGGW